MTEKTDIHNSFKQEFSEDGPVVNLVESVDYIFKKLDVPDSSYRNPSSQNNASEKMAGLTNTYLQPTRIGRKAALGSVDFFYGQKFTLLPIAFETVPFETPSDVFSFVRNRILKTLTGYISIHQGDFRLNMDVRNGIISGLVKMGFDDQFTFLSNNTVLTLGNLESIIQILLEST